MINRLKSICAKSWAADAVETATAATGVEIVVPEAIAVIAAAVTGAEAASAADAKFPATQYFLS